MLSKYLFSASSRIKRRLPAPFKQSLKGLRYKITEFFLNIIEQMTGKYFTFHSRPMFTDEILIDPEEVGGDYSEYAIVMQGPVNKKNDFTLETLKLYKKYFHNALIILSTWEEEDAKCINQARKLGVKVLLNKKPVDFGPLNINLQLTSASAGIRLASEKHKKYTLKTRTDERMYQYNFLIFLSNLIKNFPITASGFRQKGRLISTVGSKRKLYYFADMQIFGYTEDVLLYFGADFVPKNANRVIKLGDALVPYTNEQYLFTEFLKKIGYKFKDTPEDSLRALAGHCLLVGTAPFDWYFYKHQPFLEYRVSTYKQKNHIIEFPEWLNLYNLYNPK